MDICSRWSDDSFEDRLNIPKGTPSPKRKRILADAIKKVDKHNFKLYSQRVDPKKYQGDIIEGTVENLLGVRKPIYLRESNPVIGGSIRTSPSGYEDTLLIGLNGDSPVRTLEYFGCTPSLRIGDQIRAVVHLLEKKEMEYYPSYSLEQVPDLSEAYHAFARGNKVVHLHRKPGKMEITHKIEFLGENGSIIGTFEYNPRSSLY